MSSPYDLDRDEVESVIVKLAGEEDSEDVTEKDDIASGQDLEGIFTVLEPVIGLVIRNEWTQVITLLKGQRQCYVHLFGLALLRGCLAALNMDKSRFKLALSTAWAGLEQVKKKRKDTGYFYSCSANDYTDEECIAELFYSEYNGVYGVINVVDDQSIMGFIKGAYRLRICYNTLKHCEKLLDTKSNWQNDYLRAEFECGVLLGLGLFEMGISFMPRKFILLLELAGYTSNRAYGLQQIEKASAIEQSKFHKLACKAMNVVYHLFLENFYGLGEVNKQLLQDDINFGRKLAIDSDYLALADGLLQFVQGDFNSASENFNKIIHQEDNPRAIRHALCWLKSWIAVIQNDWKCALHHATILTDECKWSRALFSYMQGIFLFMLMQDDKSHSPSLQEKMMQCLENVPKLKRNFGGKKAFHEKLVIERSRQFLLDTNSILMPHLDLMYLWNLMSVAKNNETYLTRISQDISDTYIKHKENDSLDVETKFYLIFMQGVTQSLMGQDATACDAFMQVIQSAGQLKREVHLVPQACLELGLIYRKKNDHDQAILWLRKSKKYSGYLTESMIKFRADCALKSISDSQ